MPNMSSVVRFNRIPSQGFVPETSGTAPTSPVAGQLWVDTSVTPNLLRVWDGATWAVSNIYAGTTAGSFAAGNDGRIVGAEQISNKNAAGGYAGLTAGKLAYSQLPVSADGVATASTTIQATDVRLSNPRVPTDGSVTGGTSAGAGVKLAMATVQLQNLATGLTDGTAGSKQVRAIGSGAGDVVAGNDARLSDARNPNAGSVVDSSVSATAAIAETKLALASDAAAATPSRRTLGYAGNAAMPGIARLDQIGAPTSAVSLNGQRITGLGAPTVSSDAARLADIQAATAGIDAMPSVRLATTANIALTGTATQAGLDGAPVAGNRVLVKNQTTATENGVYIVASGAWARATDAISASSFWFVEEGATNADTQWIVSNNGAITLGTTPLAIAQFGAATAYTGTSGRVTVTGTQIDIDPTYAGQTSLTTTGTLTTGALGTGFTAVGLAQGGLGVDASTAAGATAARASLNAARRGYAADLGAVTAGTPLTVTHNLGSQDVIVQVRDASTNEHVMLDVINASVNTVTITSGLGYTAGSLRVVVLPVA